MPVQEAFFLFPSFFENTEVQVYSSHLFKLKDMKI